MVDDRTGRALSSTWTGSRTTGLSAQMRLHAFLRPGAPAPDAVRRRRYLPPSTSWRAQNILVVGASRGLGAALAAPSRRRGRRCGPASRGAQEPAERLRAEFGAERIRPLHSTRRTRARRGELSTACEPRPGARRAGAVRRPAALRGCPRARRVRRDASFLAVELAMGLVPLSERSTCCSRCLAGLRVLVGARRPAGAVAPLRDREGRARGPGRVLRSPHARGCSSCVRRRCGRTAPTRRSAGRRRGDGAGRGCDRPRQANGTPASARRRRRRPAMLGAASIPYAVFASIRLDELADVRRVRDLRSSRTGRRTLARWPGSASRARPSPTPRRRRPSSPRAAPRAGRRPPRRRPPAA